MALLLMTYVYDTIDRTTLQWCKLCMYIKLCTYLRNKGMYAKEFMCSYFITVHPCLFEAQCSKVMCVRISRCKSYSHQFQCILYISSTYDYVGVHIRVCTCMRACFLAPRLWKTIHVKWSLNNLKLHTKMFEGMDMTKTQNRTEFNLLL